MEILFNNFWILLILGTIINAFTLKKKASKLIAENPEKENGYNLIFKNFLIFGTIPWIIIGIGNISGFTSSVFDYFFPAKLNPFVLTFHFSLIIIWILSIRFIFFKDGAKFLENHPGIIIINTFGNVNENPSEKTIKIIVALAILGGIAGMIIMWQTNLPLPNIK